MTTVDVESPDGMTGPGRKRERAARRLVLGGPRDPRWARPGLWAVLALAGVLYVWNLGAVGDANSYYAAAVLSGTKSWTAFFFGSLDAGSFITVDKPPVSLWVMGLSARIFGYSTWSMLLPQAAAGVAAIGVLHATVRRAFRGTLGDSGAAIAALLSALVMALTPITVAINRDNNPDTVLVLLLVLGGWALQRAVEQGRLRWLLLSSVFVGLAFNTKMLQAFLVLPAFALVYLVCAKPGLWRRLWQLSAAGAALAVSAGWWMVLVDLIPAGSRPFIGSSTNNSVWDLVIGYNGLGRVFGGNGNHGGGGSAPRQAASALAGTGGQQFAVGASFGEGGGFGEGLGGSSGPGRLFNETIGGQISWLIPFAAMALITGLILLGRRHRSDPARACLLLWGGWLAVHYVIFSFSQGTFHPYYTTTMAPAIGALAGAGGVLMFRASACHWAWVLPLALVITGGWAFTLLRRTPSWHPWLAWTALTLTAAAALALLVVRPVPPGVTRWAPDLANLTLPGTGQGAAPQAPHLPDPAGVRTAGMARRSPVMRRTAICAVIAGLAGALAGPAAYAITPLASSGGGIRGTSPLAGPSTGDRGGLGELMGRLRGGFPAGLPNGPIPGGRLLPGMPPGGPADGGPGGPVDTAMIGYLVRNQGSATWLVAVASAMSADSIILRTGRPVIAMGGFAGRDPAMTVAKLQQYIRADKLHHVLVGDDRLRGPTAGSSAIDQWVAAHCKAVTATDYGGSSTSTGSQQLYRCG